MSDFSIRLNAVVNESSLQQSVQAAASNLKPIEVNVQARINRITGVSGRDNGDAFGSARAFLTAFPALSGPALGSIDSMAARLEQMAAEGSLGAGRFYELSASLRKLKADLAQGEVSFDQIQQRLKEIGDSANYSGQSITNLSERINLLTGVTRDSSKSAEKSSSVFDGPVTKAINSAEQRLRALNAEGSISAEKFETLQGKLNKLREDLNKGNISFKTASEKINDITNSANGATKGFMGMSQSLVDIGKKFLVWYLLAGVITGAVRAIKQLVIEVADLNKAFTSIQMVTGYNTQQIKELKTEYIALAKEMGVTVDTITAGADEWLRAGLSVEDTNAALRASLTLSTIAAMDSATATEYLVAAMHGFNIEAQDLIKVVDKLSAVDIESAVSAEGLGEALSYSASSANLAGIELDKYIGMVATVMETTQQSASTIGNSFRSIFTRMQKVNSGADFDDMGESISNVDTVLQQYGINLREASNNLSDMGQFLDVLSEKWKTYNTAEKSAIATTIAGNYQRERFLVLMDHYDRALELGETAAESEGSAAAKFATYLQSIEATLNTMKATFTEIAVNLVPEELIQSILGLVQAVMNVVAPVAKLVGYLLKISGFSETLDSISSIVNMVGDGLTYIMDVLSPIFDIIESLSDFAFTTSSALIEFIRDATKGLLDLYEFALKPIMDAIEWVVDKIRWLTDTVVGFFKNIGEGISDFIAGLFGADVAAKKAAQAEKDAYEEALKVLDQYLRDQKVGTKAIIDSLKKKQSELKKEKDLNDKLLAVEKAREALAEARKKRIRVFRAGVGFTYEEDTAEVQTAQESLNDAIDALSEYKYDLALERAEEFVEEFTTILSGGTILEGWEELFNKFSDLMGTEFEDILVDMDTRIRDFKGRWGGLITDKTIAGNASGTRSWRGGTTWVGENGPELVNLPKGTEILSNTRSMRLTSLADSPSSFAKGGSTATNMIFNGNLNFPNVRTADDANGFISALQTLATPKMATFR